MGDKHHSLIRSDLPSGAKSLIYKFAIRKVFMQTQKMKNVIKCLRNNEEMMRNFKIGNSVLESLSSFGKQFSTANINKKHLKTLASQKILTDTRKKILSPYVYEKLIIWKYLL